ncbi:ubiquitin receptor RAD23b-like protein [Cinnamomum micranthum f. kanehirae]|uniref:Ubiquitin receptor RAD23 n=1 Tax=Cinnamomum micranthum f. kanehirae TaxID=337451 RepID=A0A443NA27_9MAGN|nr:ubiquitin receptor RAD23b-like protein [Cinnamomum micranthum f. kanehirae]
MKLTVKTLKGSHFEIKVNPNDTVMAVKKTIEDSQGKCSYPWGQQLLIHNGKVLKDESTLEENKVSEDGFLVVMLSKTKASGSTGASSAQPSTAAPAPAPISLNEVTSQAPASMSTNDLDRMTTEVPADAYDRATSNLVHLNDLEQMIQQIIDMGGGSWDRETVVRALHAAYNNPERAVEYLYSGIPEVTEVAIPVSRLPSNQASSQGTNTITETNPAGAAPLSGLPNSSPLNMFPQGTTNLGVSGGDGSLDFLRNNIQFQTLRSLVQANPQILQPMLQELGKQNPQLMRLIQQHQAEFLQLINEPHEGAEGDLLEQAEPDMPHSISVTPEEQEAIERLEAMGFERALVIEAFLACDRNEELAVNYLLENAELNISHRRWLFLEIVELS